MTSKELDTLSINTLRFLAADAVQVANSGHPGLPLGAAPMAFIIWNRFLKHNPANPHWFDRDRFILSAGHGSALLYALLHMAGYASVTGHNIKSVYPVYGGHTVRKELDTLLHPRSGAAQDTLYIMQMHTSGKKQTSNLLDTKPFCATVAHFSTSHSAEYIT